MRKATKNAQIPPGGMGNRLKRAYLENFFINFYYNIIKIILILLVLIQDETKALQISQILKLWSKGRPLGDSDDPKATFEPQLLLFLLCLIKYRNIIRMKYDQNKF